MKIITTDAVYVQRIDLVNLMKLDANIPITLRAKVTARNLMYLDEEERCEFIKITYPEDIVYLNNLDWIIDYASIKELTSEEIQNLIDKYKKDSSVIAENYNNLSAVQKTNNIDIKNSYKTLSYKITSLKEYLYFKQNHIKMELPRELEHPVEIRYEKRIKRVLNKILARI